METLILIIVLGTSVWMAFDAHQIGYDKKDVKGMAGMGPLGWLVAGLLLWIVAFPLYLANRSKLKEAATRKSRPREASSIATDSTQGSDEKSVLARTGRGFVNVVYALGAVAVVGIALSIWFSSNPGDKMVSGQSVSGRVTITRPAAASARPEPPRQQDGSLVAKKSDDGKHLEFTGPNGQVLEIHASIGRGSESVPFRSIDAKVFPAASGGLEVRWVQLNWDGKGPGTINHVRWADSAIDFLEFFPAKGELRSARGVRIEVNETIPGHIGRIDFDANPQSLRETFDSGKKGMRSGYEEIIAELKDHPQQQARIASEMATDLARLEADYRKSVAAAENPSVRWSAL